jgi:signal peptidase I
MKNLFNLFLETAKVVIVALLIVLPIRYFLFQPFIVRGASMEPNFEESDYLIVDQLSYRFRNPERGEVIVFHYPENPQKRFIKRIIGLPKEEVTIEDGHLFITSVDGGKKMIEENYLPDEVKMKEKDILLGEDEYFVMGDNRNVSFDSRNWGPLEESYIIGKVFFQVSLFDVFAKVEVPKYNN